MSAGIYKLFMEQGATFTLQMTWRNPDQTPIDLTGCVATMRAAIVKGGTPVLDVGTATGEMSAGDATGVISINIAANVTQLIKGGVYVYEINITNPSGVVTRLLEGPMTVDGAV
jgi:hypothetical protein